MSKTCNRCEAATPDDSVLCASCHERNVCVSCGNPKGVYPRLCPSCFQVAFNNSKPILELAAKLRSTPASAVTAIEGIDLDE